MTAKKSDPDELLRNLESALKVAWRHLPAGLCDGNGVPFESKRREDIIEAGHDPNFLETSHVGLVSWRHKRRLSFSCEVEASMGLDLDVRPDVSVLRWRVTVSAPALNHDLEQAVAMAGLLRDVTHAAALAKTSAEYEFSTALIQRDSNYLEVFDALRSRWNHANQDVRKIFEARVAKGRGPN